MLVLISPVFDGIITKMAEILSKYEEGYLNPNKKLLFGCPLKKVDTGTIIFFLFMS